MSQQKLNSFSLSLEELTMSLSMINRPDLGQILLKSFYDKLTKDQVDSRMTAASHSLLAHGLCGFTSENRPRLISELEQSLLLLASYDYALQFRLVRGDQLINSTIHIKKDKGFTSHTIQAGVVHLLEHGDLTQLAPYMLDVLDNYGDDHDLCIPADCWITMGYLGKMMNSVGQQDGLKDVTKGLNWNEQVSTAFNEDIVNQQSRVTLIRINAKSGSSDEEIKIAPKQALLVLKGKCRTWFFEFPSTEDDVSTHPCVVTRKEFEDTLSAFVL